jgi:molybdopterin/thiamine biosynthesis adenylyltransferase
MLSQNEQLRYSRQIMLNKIGENGQLALGDAKVLIVGMGGLGNPVSLYLAAAGVGTLFVADGDQVELTNLQRQILFTESDIGNNKADVSAEKLQQHNSEITIEVIDDMLDAELANYYVKQVDVVIDCTDNITTRYLLNQVCVEQKTPLIVGAATGFDGQQLVVDPRNSESACYQCLFPASEKAPTNNCQTVGIVGPVLAIVAGMQSLQAIKLLTGNAIHINQLNLFDGLSNQWQQFSLKKQSDCPVCSVC